MRSRADSSFRAGFCCAGSSTLPGRSSPTPVTALPPGFFQKQTGDLPHHRRPSRPIEYRYFRRRSGNIAESEVRARLRKGSGFFVLTDPCLSVCWRAL